MLTGRATEEVYHSHRIFRFIYFFKNDPLTFLSNCKTFIWTLSSNIFNFAYLPFDFKDEKVLLKMSKYRTMVGSKKENWWRECWEGDGSLLRLMVLLLRKTMYHALALN
jgi:hypothetical protein